MGAFQRHKRAKTKAKDVLEEPAKQTSSTLEGTLRTSGAKITFHGKLVDEKELFLDGRFRTLH